MSEYKAAVVDYPAKRLVGMKVLTSMNKASVDCPALWQAFEQRFGESPGAFRQRMRRGS